MRHGPMRVRRMAANPYPYLTLIGLVALGGPDRLAAQRAAETSQSGCPGAVRRWWGQHGGGAGGRIVCAADPTRPAILLFHGLHQDARTWTAPSYVEYAYDYRDNPGEKRVGDTHSSKGVGVYKVGASKWLYGDDRAAWDQSVNWFDYLVSRGFHGRDVEPTGPYVLRRLSVRPRGLRFPAFAFEAAEPSGPTGRRAHRAQPGRARAP